MRGRYFGLSVQGQTQLSQPTIGEAAIATARHLGQTLRLLLPVGLKLGQLQVVTRPEPQLFPENSSIISD